MNVGSKRKENMEADQVSKRMKKDCNYGEKCYRMNPAHFREYSHPHLETILDNSEGTAYDIPEHLSLQKHMILDQLEVIVEKQLYVKKEKVPSENDRKPKHTETDKEQKRTSPDVQIPSSSSKLSKDTNDVQTPSTSSSIKLSSETKVNRLSVREKDGAKSPVDTDGSLPFSSSKELGIIPKAKDVDYKPVVQPKRRAEDYMKVVLPRGKMRAKHEASAPYYIFYTTITDSKPTHTQPYSITFLEILDSSLGELKCSLQINFMVDAGWLLAQYYFAGYSEKKLTILYGEDMPDLKNINKKLPQVDAHLVNMATPFGKHHTKMMILCYEDGSLRVVVSTANLYLDDWENRTQGLWFSPSCPELPSDAMPHEGESQTGFKKSLLKYLNHYHMPQLSFYVDRVKRCDFSHINVFLISSAPGAHFDFEWGLTRMGALLRQHCCVAPDENRMWPLIAQASSIGSYGKDPKLWLTGDFLHSFTKIKNQSQMLSSPPEIKIIYPSLQNVRQSHDGLLGGGCLPYAGSAHAKQPWLNNYLFQWKAASSYRDKAMPHIKSYTRVSKDAKRCAFYLLTSANVSKAAWGQINKGNGALRIMSYEAGVLFLPRFVINEDFFPLEEGRRHRLVIPYDLPPIKYTSDMTPWVSDYLSC